MTWTGFWLPNLINATVFAALATLVGLLARRWIKQAANVEWLRPLLTQIFGEQQQTKAFAQTAATAAEAAKEHAKAADQQSQTAAENLTSEETERAVLYLAEQLGIALAELQSMAGRIDGLLGTRARELATEQRQFLVPLDVGETDEAATETGRHRLHTSSINTGQIHDPYRREP